MVKLKNIAIFTSFTENRCPKQPCEEPDGMIDIDLNEVVSHENSIAEDKTNIKKPQKRNILKIVFVVAIGFVVITSAVLTLLIMDDSIISWSQPTNSNHVTVTSIEATKNLKTNLNKFEKYKLNSIFDFSKQQSKIKRDISSQYSTKMNNVDNHRKDSKKNKNLIHIGQDLSTIDSRSKETFNDNVKHKEEFDLNTYSESDLHNNFINSRTGSKNIAQEDINFQYVQKSSEFIDITTDHDQQWNTLYKEHAPSANTTTYSLYNSPLEITSTTHDSGSYENVSLSTLTSNVHESTLAMITTTDRNEYKSDLNIKVKIYDSYDENNEFMSSSTTSADSIEFTSKVTSATDTYLREKRVSSKSPINSIYDRPDDNGNEEDLILNEIKYNKHDEKYQTVLMTTTGSSSYEFSSEVVSEIDTYEGKNQMDSDRSFHNNSNVNQNYDRISNNGENEKQINSNVINYSNLDENDEYVTSANTNTDYYELTSEHVLDNKENKNDLNPNDVMHNKYNENYESISTLSISTDSYEFINRVTSTINEVVNQMNPQSLVNANSNENDNYVPKSDIKENKKNLNVNNTDSYQLQSEVASETHNHEAEEQTGSKSSHNVNSIETAKRDFVVNNRENGKELNSSEAMNDNYDENDSASSTTINTDSEVTSKTYNYEAEKDTESKSSRNINSNHNENLVKDKIENRKKLNSNGVLHDNFEENYDSVSLSTISTNSYQFRSEVDSQTREFETEEQTEGSKLSNNVNSIETDNRDFVSDNSENGKEITSSEVMYDDENYESMLSSTINTNSFQFTNEVTSRTRSIETEELTDWKLSNNVKSIKIDNHDLVSDNSENVKEVISSELMYDHYDENGDSVSSKSLSTDFYQCTSEVTSESYNYESKKQTDSTLSNNVNTIEIDNQFLVSDNLANGKKLHSNGVMYDNYEENYDSVSPSAIGTDHYQFTSEVTSETLNLETESQTEDSINGEEIITIYDNYNKNYDSVSSSAISTDSYQFTSEVTPSTHYYEEEEQTILNSSNNVSSNHIDNRDLVSDNLVNGEKLNLSGVMYDNYDQNYDISSSTTNTNFSEFTNLVTSESHNYEGKNQINSKSSVMINSNHENYESRSSSTNTEFYNVSNTDNEGLVSSTLPITFDTYQSETVNQKNQNELPTTILVYEKSTEYKTHEFELSSATSSYNNQFINDIVSTTENDVSEVELNSDSTMVKFQSIAFAFDQLPEYDDSKHRFGSKWPVTETLDTSQEFESSANTERADKSENKLIFTTYSKESKHHLDPQWSEEDTDYEFSLPQTPTSYSLYNPVDDTTSTSSLYELENRYDSKGFVSSNSREDAELNFSNDDSSTTVSFPELLRSNRKASISNIKIKLQKVKKFSEENRKTEIDFPSTTIPAATPSVATKLLSTSLPLNFRWSGQDSSFSNIKNAAKEFPSVHEQFQTNQQSAVNHNFGKTLCPTFVSPMGFPILQQAGALPYLYNSNQALPYSNVMSFPVPRAQTNPYISQQYPYSTTNLATSYPKAIVQQNGYLLYNINGENIINPSPGGQYYVCNPLSTVVGNISPERVPEVEIRKHSDDTNLQQSFASETLENRTRASGNCPHGERSCEDDSKCIKIHQFCDGDVHCKDSSDEAFCPCKFRIGKSRLCDGYFDCPHGEDELKCFGCELDTFSCDDWSPRERMATCIPLEQRCDGIPQCPTGKDEQDCSILTESLSEKQHFIISTTIGFLYRNFKGRWYPACRNPELWANEACRTESGPSTIAPLTHLVPIKIEYDGPYASASPKEHTQIVHTCEAGAAIFVECPPIVCGMRRKMRNPFRMEEIDTSAEQILSQFEKAGESFEAENVTDDRILGDSRVVGGKPSQPEAWPWVISVYRNGVFHCGGVLINELWVVTAAHCVDKYWHYYYEIQAGILRRYSYAPMVQNRMVSHVVSHQLYDRKKLKNDLALMRMSKPIKFNRYIKPICLPSEITAGQNFMWGPQPGTICTAVGWGATIEHGSDPDHLREVEVPVLKHCKHREDQEGHEICAGLMEGGKDACQGDSGGPFMCRNPNAQNQWYLAGIVSHGEGCARPNEPGVYTRVSLFLEWIFENIRAEVLPPTRPLHNCPGYICRKTNRCIANKRRCDKTVDCLVGDDEMQCDRSSFNRIFKHAMRYMFLGSKQKHLTNGTVGIPTDEQNSEVTTVLPVTSDTDLSRVTATSTTELVTNTEQTTIEPLTTSTRTYSHKKFVCTRMMQVIEISKKCDKNADCEDGTDEENCSCAEYLKNIDPKAICDATADCLDLSDEKDCVVCKENEYHCHQSNTCIIKQKRCDNVPDCPLAEDEWDCFALTDGKTVTLDGNFRPHLNSSGIVTFNHNGTWRIVCSNWTDAPATLAADICFYLGFSDYKSFLTLFVYNNPLKIIQETLTSVANTLPISNNKCMALFIKCSDVVDTNHAKHEAISKIAASMQGTPWNSEIYINGKFNCMGTILNTDWIITSVDCFEGDFNLTHKYVTVLLGGGKSYLNIAGPHEQVIRITESIRVFNSDIILLRVGNSIKVSRYIRPIGFSVRDYTVSEKETCIATGRNLTNLTESVLLTAVVNCSNGFRCFKRTEPTDELCEHKNINPWSGCLVCRSKHGWYPAAVFQERKGSCGFTNAAAYTSVQHWRANILKLMEQASFAVDAPPCKGFRCNLGQCIQENKICDGVPDCHDAADEDSNYCKEIKKHCEKSSTCVCLKSELKCRNGNCVPKTSFCNKHNDCGDWSDEPDSCTCGAYLNLTNPDAICDGIRNCQDRTDEDPHICKCKRYHFLCGDPNFCIPQDMVCDGVSDCPNGEDESHCISLTSTTDNSATEVQVQTAGVWHPGCFPKYLTTLQLEDICKKIGYIGGSAIKINPGNDMIRKTTWRPVKDPFIGIWIHQTGNKKLMLAMRTDSKPFVSLKPDSSCYRLFLQCL